MQLTYKDVRFEVQIYTDKGPTNKFKNGYNPEDKFINKNSYLIHPSLRTTFLKRDSINLSNISTYL